MVTQWLLNIKLRYVPSSLRAKKILLLAVSCGMISLLLLYGASPFSRRRYFGIHDVSHRGDPKKFLPKNSFKGTESLKDPEVYLLNRNPLKFLPHLQNPCWYETLHTAGTYLNNPYLRMSQSVQEKMVRLTSKWAKLIQKDASGTVRRLRCLPYFFIAGQPKCGTTDLYRRVTSHPDVIKAPLKEPHWWTRLRFGKYANGDHQVVPLYSYVDLFDNVADIIQRDNRQKSITCDASASTLWDNDFWWQVPDNVNKSEPIVTNAHYVHHVIPNARIIVLLRNPVDRLYSDYLYFRKEKSAIDFHNRVVRAIEVYRNCTDTYSARLCAYNQTVALQSGVRLRIGLYWIFIQDWLNVFPKHQVLILRTEDYAASTRSIIRRIFKFLGLRLLNQKEEDSVLSMPVANVRKINDKRVGKMYPETKKLLSQYYETHNQRLSEMMGDKRYTWYL